MTQPNILVWGAGRIGRGFAADLFDAAGYRITFVDQSEPLVASLRERGQYIIVCAESAEHRRDRVISRFRAYTTAQIEEIAAAITDADIMAVCVFPKDFAAVAQAILPGLLKRQQERPAAPFDVILFTNLAHAGPQFYRCLEEAKFFDKSSSSLNESLGIVETLVIRMVAEPPSEELARDPLLVWTNGYAELPADRRGFKGTIPALPGLRLVDDMRAEEMRKLYTYNTFHAAVAYFGRLHGHEKVVDCLTDPQVSAEAEAALAESSAALQAEYGFTTAEMSRWNAGVLAQTNNPALRDTVARFGADPRRKLARTDRLIGPILLCRQHGLPFDHLARTAAAALHQFVQEANERGQTRMKNETVLFGNSNPRPPRLSASEFPLASIKEVCGLNSDAGDDVADIVAAIAAAYHQIQWATLAEQAGKLAFDYEQTYHGCGQCAFAAISETLGNFDSAVFEAATALAGGLGLVGDSTCAALLGATLAFGLVSPRHRDQFGGDTESKYRAYLMAQKLRQKYLDAYGSMRCHDIHRGILGRPFDLRDPAERKAFEAAGAHDDKCTGVVSRAAQWAVEIIGEEDL